MKPTEEKSIDELGHKSLSSKIGNEFYYYKALDVVAMRDTMAEYFTVMSRAKMGGNKGIHKPTSGNPNSLRSM